MNGVPCGPLIRPTGTFSPRGEEGIETLRQIPFAPAGRRWPEGSDEGAARHKAYVITQHSAISAKSGLTPSPEWPFLREMHSKDQTDAPSSSHHRHGHDRRRAFRLPDDDARGAAGGG
ncbi:hypothetical protein GFL39_30885 [Rhizobium leguminosarum bv. viciae]|nr:hypothetical protein [Rhizobium leguminosarum bv. viciae]NKL94202.1 hypothetical protein [Rhizobium leguminosarum bv. viciae]NKM94175.1 hypothetical protein [Rhizobium leguminosarum bv. viciae]